MTLSPSERFATCSAVLLLVFGLPRANADPIVFQNTSYIFGFATVLEDGRVVNVGNFFDTSEPAPSPPLTGTWGLSDTRSAALDGARAYVASSVGATLTSDGFSGSGRVTSTAEADSASATLTAESWGRSVFNVSFQLLEPHSFSYTGRYLADTDTLFGGLVGRLEGVDVSSGTSVFSDAFRFFPGAIDRTISHAGLVGPGLYSLVLVSDPLPVDAPGATRKIGGFDFTFALAPAAVPTPEPATFMLVGGGTLALAAGKWRWAKAKGQKGKR